MKRNLKPYPTGAQDNKTKNNVTKSLRRVISNVAFYKTNFLVLLYFWFCQRFAFVVLCSLLPFLVLRPQGQGLLKYFAVLYFILQLQPFENVTVLCEVYAEV